jgi:MOSC domain-containing protein YiiM
MEPLTTAELEAGLETVRAAPADSGRLELIVRRPAVGERETIEEGQLDTQVGLVGDTWRDRPSSSTPDKSAHPEKQLTVMNARFASLVAQRDDRRPLAGDQLYVDLDISQSNLPPGTRLAIGSAVIEVTEPPHTGCAKFTQRFGHDAFRFVNSPLGLDLRLRGLNAKVVAPGTVRVGDEVRKVDAEREEHYERPVDRFRRGAAGSVIAAGLLGLRDAMEGRPQREETVITSEAPSQPHDDGLDITLDPDHPERSIVIVRRPAATEETEP